VDCEAGLCQGAARCVHEGRGGCCRWAATANRQKPTATVVVSHLLALLLDDDGGRDVVFERLAWRIPTRTRGLPASSYTCIHTRACQSHAARIHSRSRTRCRCATPLLELGDEHLAQRTTDREEDASAANKKRRVLCTVHPCHARPCESVFVSGGSNPGAFEKHSMMRCPSR
jgi:hypothetical protein